MAIELWWRPSHQGGATNKPTPRSGIPQIRRPIRKKPSPPKFLVHLERSITETKWKEAKTWMDVKVTYRKYRNARSRSRCQPTRLSSGSYVTVSLANISLGRKVSPPPSVGGRTDT